MTATIAEPSVGQIKGSGILVWIEGDAIMIKYGVLHYGFLGTKRVPVENIKSLTWNEPGTFISGWLEIAILGEPPPNMNASPNVQRQNRLKFDDPQREQFFQLKSWIESRMTKASAASPAPVADELEKLANLRDRGILRADEFAEQQ